jgi:hypothetical protein
MKQRGRASVLVIVVFRGAGRRTPAGRDEKKCATPPHNRAPIGQTAAPYRTLVG